MAAVLNLRKFSSVDYRYPNLANHLVLFGNDTTEPSICLVGENFRGTTVTKFDDWSATDGNYDPPGW